MSVNHSDPFVIIKNDVDGVKATLASHAEHIGNLGHTINQLSQRPSATTTLTMAPAEKWIKKLVFVLLGVTGMLVALVVFLFSTVVGLLGQINTRIDQINSTTGNTDLDPKKKGIQKPNPLMHIDVAWPTMSGTTLIMIAMTLVIVALVVYAVRQERRNQQTSKR